MDKPQEFIEPKQDNKTWLYGKKIKKVIDFMMSHENRGLAAFEFDKLDLDYVNKSTQRVSLSNIMKCLEDEGLVYSKEAKPIAQGNLKQKIWFVNKTEMADWAI